MKKFTVVLLLMFPCLVFSQNLPTVSNLPIDSISNLITYKFIGKTPKATSDQIYSKIRAWFANTYNSANNVLQMDDKASGTLIAKGVFSYPNLQAPSFVKYTLTVNIKPGKFRITITNYTLNIAGDETLYPLENMYRGFKNDAHAKDEIDFSVKSQLINMLKDVDDKSKSIVKSLSDFMVDNKKDDF